MKYHTILSNIRNKWGEWFEHRRQELFGIIVIVLFLSVLFGFREISHKQDDGNETLQEVKAALIESNEALEQASLTINKINDRTNFWTPFTPFAIQDVIAVTETTVSVQGEKCVDPTADPRPVEVTGNTTLKAFSPAGVAYIPIKSGSRFIAEGEPFCYRRTYVNDLPIEEMRKYPQVKLWQFIGTDTPYDAAHNAGTPENWQTEPFEWNYHNKKGSK